MSKADFFKEPKEHSIAKMEMVSKYFAAWAKIMMRSCEVLTYLDLFSGRGVYEEGTHATPLRIMDEIGEINGLAGC